MTEKTIPWEQIKFEQFTANDLAEALRARELVTTEDIRYNQKAALGVLQALYKIDLGKLNEFAFSERKPAPKRAPFKQEVKDG